MKKKTKTQQLLEDLGNLLDTLNGNIEHGNRIGQEALDWSKSIVGRQEVQATEPGPAPAPTPADLASGRIKAVYRTLQGDFPITFGEPEPTEAPMFDPQRLVVTDESPGTFSEIAKEMTEHVANGGTIKLVSGSADRQGQSFLKIFGEDTLEKLTARPDDLATHRERYAQLEEYGLNLLGPLKDDPDWAEYLTKVLLRRLGTSRSIESQRMIAEAANGFLAGLRAEQRKGGDDL